MAISSGGMGQSPRGNNPLPKYKKPKKGTQTVSAIKPVPQPKRKKRKKSS